MFANAARALFLSLGLEITSAPAIAHDGMESYNEGHDASIPLIEDDPVYPVTLGNTPGNTRATPIQDAIVQIDDKLQNLRSTMIGMWSGLGVISLFSGTALALAVRGRYRKMANALTVINAGERLNQIVALLPTLDSDTHNLKELAIIFNELCAMGKGFSHLELDPEPAEWGLAVKYQALKLRMELGKIISDKVDKLDKMDGPDLAAISRRHSELGVKGLLVKFALPDESPAAVPAKQILAIDLDRLTPRFWQALKEMLHIP